MNINIAWLFGIGWIGAGKNHQSVISGMALNNIISQTAIKVVKRSVTFATWCDYGKIF